MKTVWFIFLMLSFFLVAELTLRLTGIYQTYSEKNFNRYASLYNQTLALYDFTNRKDSIYYRQNEFSYTCPSNDIGLRTPLKSKPDLSKITYLFLGDSFTEGVGASCGHSMPQQLEKLLPDSIRVVNAGVVGSDPFLQSKYYDSLFYRYQPQKVFFVLNYSDVSEYIFRGGNQRFVSDSTWCSKLAPAIERFYKYSHLLRFIVHFVFQYDFTLLPKKEVSKRSEEALLAMAKELNQWSEKHSDIETNVVLHPYPFAYKKKVPGHDLLPTIENYLTKEITVYNLYDDFADTLNQHNYLNYSWKADGHFNDKGYQLFATLLYKRLQTTKAR